MTQDFNPRNRPGYNDNFRPDLGENQKYFRVRNEVQDLMWGVGRGSEREMDRDRVGDHEFSFFIISGMRSFANFCYDFCAVFVSEFKTKIYVF